MQILAIRDSRQNQVLIWGLPLVVFVICISCGAVHHFRLLRHSQCVSRQVDIFLKLHSSVLCKVDPSKERTIKASIVWHRLATPPRMQGRARQIAGKRAKVLFTAFHEAGYKQNLVLSPVLNPSVVLPGVPF